MPTHVLVAATIPAYKAADSDPGESLAWLDTADAMVRQSHYPVDFFASLELDARGLSVFDQVTKQLMSLSGQWWTFSIDNGAHQISSSDRLPRICAGRNLIIEYALRQPYSHILFLDSDLRVPDDSVDRLLDLDRPMVGGVVPAYCQSGPVVYPPNVQEHWNTAGFLLVRRDVWRIARWGIDPDAGMTDDPHFARTAELLGFGKTWVDHDLKGIHKPLVPVEHRGHDLKVYREA